MTRPRPSARRAQPRSRPIGPAWNRPRPTIRIDIANAKAQVAQAQAAVEDAETQPELLPDVLPRSTAGSAS